MKWLVDTGDHPAELLGVGPFLKREPASGEVSGSLPIRQREKTPALLRRQRDVADPPAGR